MLSILKKPSNQSVVWFFCLNICDKNIVFFGKCDTVGTIFLLSFTDTSFNLG